MARTVPSAATASTLGGLWFVFRHAGKDFALWVSSFTGKEELYVNGALVTQRRKIALTSDHTVELDGSNYVLALRTRNVRRGVYECSLAVNGHIVAGLETEYVARKKWQQRVSTIVGTAVFAYLGFSGSLPVIPAASGVAAAAILSFALFGRESGYVVRPVSAPTVSEEGSHG